MCVRACVRACVSTRALFRYSFYSLIPNVARISAEFCKEDVPHPHPLPHPSVACTRLQHTGFELSSHPPKDYIHTKPSTVGLITEKRREKVSETDRDLNPHFLGPVPGVITLPTTYSLLGQLDERVLLDGDQGAGVGADQSSHGGLANGLQLVCNIQGVSLKVIPPSGGVVRPLDKTCSCYRNRHRL